jgi:hypothetical protein
MPPRIWISVRCATETNALGEFVKAQIVPALIICSVYTDAYRHYNAIAAYNQIIKIPWLSDKLPFGDFNRRLRHECCVNKRGKDAVVGHLDF